jgi:DNA-binding NarL/FixJ family response regulator
VTENPLRVVVADDDVLLREGIASLLERFGYEVAGQAADGPELIELARLHRPDLVIADIRMPPSHTTEGLDAARQIQEELTAREREVLSLMAEGRSNAGIARLLVVTEGTVEKHVHSILQKLNLWDASDDHRRVLAVLAFLDSR